MNIVTIMVVLFIVFLVLKLCGVITWAWIWVLSPIWLPIAIAVIIFVYKMAKAGLENFIDN